MGVELNERKALINRWGLPDTLKHKENDIIFKIDEKGLSGTKESGYDVKLCLYEKESENVILTMEFFKSGRLMTELMKCSRLRLELLFVNDAYRKKGIASYYIEKLIQFAIQENFKCILVKPNANDNIFKGISKKDALSQDKLRDFYIKRSTKEMPIEFTVDTFYIK